LVLLGVAFALIAHWWLLSLPLEVYSSFRLPHRFGLSNQSAHGWVVDRVKGLAIGAALGVPILLVLYTILRLLDPWWVWASLGYAGLTIVLTTLGPVVFIPIFNRLRPLDESHRELRDRLTRLSQVAGVHIRSVDTMDLSRRTKAANAVLVGLGPTRRIVLGDTLLESFDMDEAETVVAHEFGHHVHGDIATGLLVQSSAAVAVFALMDLVLRSLVRGGRLESLADPAGWPAFVLTWSVLAFLEAPWLNAYSRWREARADEFALRLSGKAEAFTRAMVRLGDQNLAEADPPGWAVLLFGTHPPLAKRMEMALAARVREAPLGRDR
jgi:STE24 endopeptidase